MPRRGERSIKVLPGDPLDPHGWPRMIEGFGDWMGAHGYAERTVENRRKSMAQVATWLIDRGVTRPAEVTKAMLERYQRWLFHYRKANGKPLSFRSQHARLVPVRAFFKWAAKENRILYNPAGELELPRVERSLPKAVLTAAEAERVLAQPDLDTATGVRDRAILEVFYSTGVRRMELVNLLMFDIDIERRTLFVRQGKGRKDRMIPIGARAIVWCERYLRDVRHLWAPIPDEGILFLTVDGTALSPGRLTSVVRDYVNRSGVGKKGSCHLFRHSMATLMLEGGADIRWIQAMLGHADISTTQIYTKISVRQLQAVHDLTHPGATNQRHRDPETARLLADAGLDPDPVDAVDTAHHDDGDGAGEESVEFSLGPRLNHYAKDLVAEKQPFDLKNRPAPEPPARDTAAGAGPERREEAS